MKKVFAIILVLMVAAALAVPAMADEEKTVTTSVTVPTTTTGPIVKAKWELQVDSLPASFPDFVEAEWFNIDHKWYISGTPVDFGGTVDGDADEATAGTQVLATPGTLSAVCPDPAVVPVPGESYVAYFAVIEYKGSAQEAWVNVYHPNAIRCINLSGSPCVQVDDEWCGSFKYQNSLYNLRDFLAANSGTPTSELQLTMWQDVVSELGFFTDGGLVTLASGNPTDVIADIEEELMENLADIWIGYGELNTHQPAGDYTVEVKARVQTAYTETPLENIMQYLELVSFRTDFDGIDYGSVSEGLCDGAYGDGFPGPIPGAMCTPLKPTVWNNGNTYIQMRVAQDDMGFGKSNDVWDVGYKARVGSGNEADYTAYDPACYTSDLDGSTPTIPLLAVPLIMCTPTKMDFQICPIKSGGITDPFEGYMLLEADQIPFEPCGQENGP